jgi:hypothetical protein
MIHSAPEMLHEEKRRAVLLSETAVSETNPLRFNGLCGGRDVSVCHATFVPLCVRARLFRDPRVAVLGAVRAFSSLAARASTREDENPSKSDVPS